ncbi:MAG: trypsin-like peptidase domain-containing protein [Anaerolineae bacterium]|nr:trypsin-like peptidase domain-containing protein [Anaerolineae bacterium]
MKTKLSVLSVLTVLTLLMAACSGLPALSKTTATAAPTNAPTAAPTSAPTQAAAPAVSGNGTAALAALQGTLESIYTQVNPSVVNIQVTSKVSADESQFPFTLPAPFNEQPSQPKTQQALGSGFVWDNDGHIITNNHVVDGAEKVSVTFSDGSVSSASVVGKDPDADLAVIKLDENKTLAPLTLADSDQVKVGQLAVAIGNPFGLEGTMTVGFVSALGRSLPVESGATSSASYTIPDVIQTDAPINPGNSGGVLVNDQGQVMGVTAAIESSGGSNAGIGFVIPANIVQRVVPELIKNGKFEHAWLGISGSTLSPAVAKEMKLADGQRGILVASVTSGSPADKAGIQGSSRQVKIDDNDTLIGGDVISAVDGQPVQAFDDLVSYLFKKGEVGQKLSLDIIRDGKTQTVDVTLAARPAGTNAQKNTASSENGQQAWLGIQGMSLNADVNKAMSLKDNQEGVLVVRVVQGSPADKAGFLGSSKTAEIQGQQVEIGGDVITAVNNKPVKSIEELKGVVSDSKPGDVLDINILRDGKESSLKTTLEAAPGN